MTLTAEPSPDMVIDEVDERNVVVGQIPRSAIFTSKAGFRTVHGLLFTSSNQVIIQQQSAARARTPLTWGSSVSAYLFSGESYLDAFRRRAMQELGVTVVEPRLAFVQRQIDLGHDKFVGFVLAKFRGSFNLDSSQVRQLKAVSLSELEGLLADHEVPFTNTFRELMGEYFGRRREGHKTS